MKTLLDVLTILGGIAAIWSFWDRFTSYRSRKKSRGLEKDKRTTRFKESRSLPIQEMIWAAVSCAVAGVIVGVISVKYSWAGAALFFWVGLVVFLIGASLGLGVMELAGGFMGSWSFVALIIVGPIEAVRGVPFAESEMGTVFIFISGLLGAVFGAWQVNDAVYRFVHYREY
jgi:hypothetical protein